MDDPRGQASRCVQLMEQRCIITGLRRVDRVLVFIKPGEALSVPDGNDVCTLFAQPVGEFVAESLRSHKKQPGSVSCCYLPGGFERRRVLPCRRIEPVRHVRMST